MTDFPPLDIMRLTSRYIGPTSQDPNACTNALRNAIDGFREIRDDIARWKQTVDPNGGTHDADEAEEGPSTNQPSSTAQRPSSGTLTSEARDPAASRSVREAQSGARRRSTSARGGKQ